MQVKKVVFGNSYKVQLTPNVSGFLHKIHTVKTEKSTADEEETQTKVELEKGQKIDKIRVKEINYFDGCPILSMKDDIVNSSVLNYDSLKCGMFVSATIEEVNE